MINESARFGWCLDGHHRKCRVQFDTQQRERIRCGCWCHSQRKRGSK